ncbi:alpha-hydroxy-acid oxidizing protein [Salsuginibacillus kocurii]|uniref:alpha-hydroxy-acid oxidizing protein n=1 Tax=Salsuginibacillus kocurii TaxID=427078 RepID=UPI000382112F|nr:alpha-hydroxy-acid oxidizing protein [Salsuginibacillus kocurii]
MNFKTQLEDYQATQSMSKFPYSFEEWEAMAKKVLSSPNYDYVAAGAGSEDTMRENVDAFKRWRIQPRMFRDVEQRDTTTTILGTQLESPIMMAPVGVQKILHERGDLASAKAAGELGVPFVCSTVSAYSLEEIAAEVGEDTLKWFQLYWSTDEQITSSLLKRAEAAGYSAIVVTLDTPMVGWRERDLNHRWLPFLEGIGIANYISDPVFKSRMSVDPGSDLQAAGEEFRKVFGNTKLSWRDLEFVREQTSLPIILKGILHPHDAELAIHYGVDGVIVSNHGGRQVNGAISAIDALPEIAEVVQGQIPVLMDSGIRRGDDVLKALALGAEAVLVGRPYLYGLAVGGREGVKQILRNLKGDFELTMALSGVKQISEITPALIRKTTN